MMQRLPATIPEKANTAALAIPKETLVEAATRLAQHPPEHNDERVEGALAVIAGGALVINTAWDFGADIEKVTSVPCPRGIDQAGIDKALRTLELANAPASNVAITEALAKLDYVTPGDTEEKKLQIRNTVLREKLAAYPADVVLMVLDQPYDFFPSWGELFKRLEPTVSRRRAVYRAVQRWQPWTDTAELAYQKERLFRAQWDARHYRHRDPARASKADVDVLEVQKKIEAITGPAPALNEPTEP